MADEGADFGFVGGAYEAPDPLQDAQRLINWFCEVDPSMDPKEPIALLGTSGLLPILTAPIGFGAVRGAWVLPGNTQCIFVIFNVVYLVTVTVPATQASIPQFNIQQLGTLLTNNGRVVIRDNGVLFNGLGGFAVLVDGQFGYFFNLTNTQRPVSFPGNLTVGSPTISFPPGVLVPNTLVVSGGIITDSAGALPINTTITAISFTANTITLSANALSNQTADTFTLTIPIFAQILDPAFLQASRVVFTEGWLGFNQVGTRTFFTNAPVPYTLCFAGAFYALKDSSTDNLVTMMENNREWWEIGERTSEVWYNAGGANFSFSRLPGIGPQVGCSAQHSISRVGNELAWLARIGEAGENVVVMTEQYGWRRVSTHAIEHAIKSYPVVSDAIGDCYEDEGHLIYQLTFPTADVTWCLDVTVYDLTQGKLGWFQRLTWDTNNGVYHRHRANCMVNFADVLMAGDYTSGQIHQQSRKVFTDAGGILRRQRRTPHVWDKGKRQRIFAASLQIEFTPGVGLQVGQGSNPQVMIRWSNDGGLTWSNEHLVPIGMTGETKNRALLRRLGRFRDRVWEVNFTDPVQADIIGATLFGEAEEEAA